MRPLQVDAAVKNSKVLRVAAHAATASADAIWEQKRAAIEAKHAGEMAELQMEMNRIKVGQCKQRPQLESTPQFQTLILDEHNSAFNLSCRCKLDPGLKAPSFKL